VLRATSCSFLNLYVYLLQIWSLFSYKLGKGVPSNVLKIAIGVLCSVLSLPRILIIEMHSSESPILNFKKISGWFVGYMGKCI
jgi:hypothetical protein